MEANELLYFISWYLDRNYRTKQDIKFFKNKLKNPTLNEYDKKELYRKIKIKEWDLEFLISKLEKLQTEYYKQGEKQWTIKNN